MLIGEFYHTIDNRSRLVLPAKLSEELGKTVIIAAGDGEYLMVYSLAGWQAVPERERLSKGNSVVISDRDAVSGARVVNVDRSGRICIPEDLRRHARLRSGAVIFGVYDHLEIRNSDKSARD